MFFAVDLGATSGRTILGTFTPEGLEMEDVNRFPNRLIETGGHFYWDIYELYRNIIEGLKIVAQRGDVEITSIGIDTWGVDLSVWGKMEISFVSPILIEILIPSEHLTYSLGKFPVNRFMSGRASK